jgi:hypothetical protein
MATVTKPLQSNIKPSAPTNGGQSQSKPKTLASVIGSKPQGNASGGTQKGITAFFSTKASQTQGATVPTPTPHQPAKPNTGTVTSKPQTPNGKQPSTGKPTTTNVTATQKPQTTPVDAVTKASVPKAATTVSETQYFDGPPPCSWSLDNDKSLASKSEGKTSRTGMYDPTHLTNPLVTGFRNKIIKVKDQDGSTMTMRIVWAGLSLPVNNLPIAVKKNYSMSNNNINVAVEDHYTKEDIKKDTFDEWFFFFRLLNDEFVPIPEDVLPKLIPKYINITQVPDDNKIEVDGITLPMLPPRIFKERTARALMDRNINSGSDAFDGIESTDNEVSRGFRNKLCQGFESIFDSPGSSSASSTSNTTASKKATLPQSTSKGEANVSKPTPQAKKAPIIDKAKPVTNVTQNSTPNTVTPKPQAVKKPITVTKPVPSPPPASSPRIAKKATVVEDLDVMLDDIEKSDSTKTTNKVAENDKKKPKKHSKKKKFIVEEAEEGEEDDPGEEDDENGEDLTLDNDDDDEEEDDDDDEEDEYEDEEDNGVSAFILDRAEESDDDDANLPDVFEEESTILIKTRQIPKKEFEKSQSISHPHKPNSSNIQQSKTQATGKTGSIQNNIKMSDQEVYENEDTNDSTYTMDENNDNEDENGSGDENVAEEENEHKNTKGNDDKKSINALNNYIGKKDTKPKAISNSSTKSQPKPSDMDQEDMEEEQEDVDNGSVIDGGYSNNDEEITSGFGFDLDLDILSDTGGSNSNHGGKGAKQKSKSTDTKSSSSSSSSSKSKRKETDSSGDSSNNSKATKPKKAKTQNKPSKPQNAAGKLKRNGKAEHCLVTLKKSVDAKEKASGSDTCENIFEGKSPEQVEEMMWSFVKWFHHVLPITYKKTIEDPLKSSKANGQDMNELYQTTEFKEFAIVYYNYFRKKLKEPESGVVDF